MNARERSAIENALELEKVVNELLNKEEELISRSAAAKNYVYKNAGATDKIISFHRRNKLTAYFFRLYIYVTLFKNLNLL